MEKIISVDKLNHNISAFLSHELAPRFKKNSKKEPQTLAICKEDKEHLTKAKMVLMEQLFIYASKLDDSSFRVF